MSIIPTFLSALIFFMAGVLSLNACSCPSPGDLSEAQAKEFEASDFVFLAMVEEIFLDKEQVIVTIQEVFKGDLQVGKQAIVTNNFTCEPSINSPGIWLIYGMKTDGGIDMNDCGLSRSIEHPEHNGYFLEPPPTLPLDSNISDEQWKVKVQSMKEEQRKVALHELQRELELLRKRKENSTTEKINGK